MGCSSSKDNKKRKQLTQTQNQNDVPYNKSQTPKTSNKKQIQNEQSQKAKTSNGNTNNRTYAKETLKEPIEDTQISICIKMLDSPIIDDKFDNKLTLKEVLLTAKTNPLFDYILLNEKNEPLTNYLQTPLKTLFNPTDKKKKELTLKYIGLDIPQNCRSEYSKTNIIATLILDNPEYFSVIAYNKNSNDSHTYFYSKNYNTIKAFGIFSSFCNANNKLYISGGEYYNETEEKEEILNDFVEIDLTSLSTESFNSRELKNLNQARTWHSMIYIPEKFIFIVGGTQNSTVEVYNIENNTMTIDSEMNEERSEATLCLINDLYLYAFGGFILLQSHVTSVERCNLRREKRKWELVDYKVPEGVTLHYSFFGVGYYKNEGVLLIGGKENNEEERKDYLYKIGEGEEKDSIEEYQNFEKDKVPIVFKEKFFIPINEKNSMMFPLATTGYRVFILNNKSGELEIGDMIEIESMNEIF